MIKAFILMLFDFNYNYKFFGIYKHTISKMAANLFKLRRRNGPTDLYRLDLQYRTRRKFSKVSFSRASSRTLTRGAFRARKIAED